MHYARRYALLRIAGASLALSACNTAPGSRDNVLDSRLAGPCDRLILSWSEDASQLQELMGHSFEPRTGNAVGEFQLNLLRCRQQSAGQRPLTFAFPSVPISADSAPLVITHMPDDGWVWLPAVIVDSDSLAMFSGMNYQVNPAEIVFEVDHTRNPISITAQLIFESGGISIAVTTAGEETAVTRNQAMTTADPQYHSVLFGKETANRYELGSIDVDVQGTLPPGFVDLGRQPKRAVWDSGLRLDYVYWQLPRSQSEPLRSEEL